MNARNVSIPNPPISVKRVIFPDWEEICYLWDDCREIARDAFLSLMMDYGWKRVVGRHSSINDEYHIRCRYDGAWKDALILPAADLVLKFDKDYDGESHSQTEIDRWKFGKPESKRYMAPIYAHYKGLILQRRVLECNMEKNCADAIKIAIQYKFSHFIHHGHLPNGRILFFDYDRLGVVA